MKRNRSKMDNKLKLHEQCELCGSNKSLEVHHIIPLSFGGDNSEENMIVVCRMCHTKLTPHKLLTKKGLENAKQNGKQIGRSKGVKVETNKSKECKPLIYNHSKSFIGNMSDSDLIKFLDIAPNTFYKYKKEIKNENAI